MTEIQDIIASMIHPCEYIGGPLAGQREDAVATHYICLPFADGFYVLVSIKGGRLIYEWRGERCSDR